MNNKQSDNIDERLWSLLQQAYDTIAKIRNFELEQQGSSLMQAAVLEVISSMGKPASTVQIKKQFIREHHTISALLERMEKRGLLRSTPNPAQKRSSLYSLTDMGHELLEKSRDTATIRKIFSTISEQDKQRLVDPLQKLRHQALEELVLQKAKSMISQFTRSE
jgi:MarR family transcriptional regulator, organic hydroperoxide resistance regulator